jgi:multiple antibiotic resistance protein
MFFPLDVFMALFVTMGPFKVVLVYAELTRDLEPAVRRKIAFRAVVVAAIVGLLFIILGKFLMDLFHFSLGALQIAGGLILFAFALNMVLGGGEDEAAGTDKDPEKIAAFPLAMPLMATPIGIVALTLLSATFNDDTTALIITGVILLVVMVINLIILLTESRILKYVDAQAVGVAERILGILLAALAVQTIINGLIAIGALPAGGHG